MRRASKRVWWSPRSRQDLEEISRYLYKIAPGDLAEKLICDILDAAEDLSARALLWRVRMDVGANVRTVLVRPYMIFYRVMSSEVEVMRVLHGAQDIEEIFNTEDDPRL